MKELIVIGASGFGKEVVWLANRAGRVVKGFLDDTPEKQGTTVFGKPVLGIIEDYAEHKDCDFIIALGSPTGRKYIADKLGNEVKYATLIDPSAIIDLINRGTSTRRSVLPILLS